MTTAIEFCLAADEALAAIRSEATAMAGHYGMIKVLVGKRSAGQVNPLVSMAETIAEGKESHQKVANVARRFLNDECCEADVLVKDERLSYATRQRKPVVLAYPGSHITSPLTTLAAKLSNGLAAATRRAEIF